MKRLNVLIIAVLLATTSFVFSACSEKVVLSPYDFRSAMEERGFEIYTDDPNESISGLTDTIEADNDDYEIEYAQFDKKDSALAYYNDFLDDADENISEKNNMVETKDYCHFDDGEYFYIISCSDNTIVACRAKIKYRAEVIGLFEDIGYGE